MGNLFEVGIVRLVSTSELHEIGFVQVQNELSWDCFKAKGLSQRRLDQRLRKRITTNSFGQPSYSSWMGMD